MKPITCLADAINHVPMVRVIKEWDENYWKEFCISINNHLRQIVSIYYEDRCITYKYSEVQFLTPVQYEWRYIGMGDKVSWREVFDYCWHDDKWNVRYAIGWDYTNIDILSELQVNRLRTFEPLHQLTPKIELSTEEMIEELQRRGKIFYVNGNIIKK